MSTPHEALRALPQLPHLDHLKNQARALQRATERADPAALGRVAASHPRFAKGEPASGSISLGDAQLVVAREYGFASWSRLKSHVELSRRARPATLTLPVVRVDSLLLVPEATLAFHYSDAERPAIERARANQTPILCIPERAEAERGSFGVLAWPGAPRGVRAGRQQTLLWVRARAKLGALESVGGVLQAEAELSPEFTWSSASKAEAVTRLYDTLVRLSLQIVWLSRPELSRFREDGDLGRLLGVALKLLEPDELSQCSALSDPPETIELVCRLLAERPAREPSGALETLLSTARRRAPAASVVVLRSEAHPHACGRRYDLSLDVTRIGRAEESEITLYSEAVSRAHARIERQGSKFFVVDEGSVNGTFRQGEEERVTRRELLDGDRLLIGDAILGFSSGGDLDEKYLRLVDELGREDPLTRLRNRASWLAELERRVFAARGSSSALSVLMLDIDGLRAENERLGRLVGDRLIVEVARALRDAAPASSVARYGGGTFCLTLVGSEPERALEVAGELSRAVKDRTVTFEGETIRVTVSGGVASLDTTLGSEELVEQALTALGQAKAEGGDRVISS